MLAGQLSAVTFTECQAARALGDGYGYKYGKDAAPQEHERRKGLDGNDAMQPGGQARTSRQYLWVNMERKNNSPQGSGKTSPRK